MHRVFRRFRKNKALTSPQPSELWRPENYDDRRRTLERYAQAVRLFQTLKVDNRYGEMIDFPELSNDLENFDCLEFRDCVAAVLQAWTNTLDNNAVWSKLTNILEGISALGPLSKNLLAVAMQGQSVTMSHFRI